MEFCGPIRLFRIWRAITWQHFRAYSAYRANLIASALCTMVPVLGFIWTWSASRSQEPSTRSPGEIGVYYVLVLIVATWTDPSGVVGEVSAEIEDGALSRYLVRPLPHFWYYFACRIASAMQSTVAVLFPFIIALLVWKRTLVVPETLVKLAAALILLAIGTIIGFCVGYLIRIMAFFTTKTWGISRLAYLTISLCSGSVVPLDLLPRWARAFCEATPFPTLVYTPVTVYLGAPGTESPWSLIAYSGCWAVGLALATNLLFHAGLRRYTASGG